MAARNWMQNGLGVLINYGSVPSPGPGSYRYNSGTKRRRGRDRQRCGLLPLLKGRCQILKSRSFTTDSNNLQLLVINQRVKDILDPWSKFRHGGFSGSSQRSSGYILWGDLFWINGKYERFVNNSWHRLIVQTWGQQFILFVSIYDRSALPVYIISVVFLYMIGLYQ
jgi:hypothetical protein